MRLFHVRHTFDVVADNPQILQCTGCELVVDISLIRVSPTNWLPLKRCTPAALRLLGVSRTARRVETA